jgi:hypothetical protein
VQKGTTLNFPVASEKQGGYLGRVSFKRYFAVAPSKNLATVQIPK